MDPSKILTDLRQLAADVRAKAGIIKIMRDCVALADDGIDLGAVIAGMVSPQPDAPPAVVGAHAPQQPLAALQTKVGAFLPHDQVADQLDQCGDELAQAHSKLPPGQVGAFGDGSIMRGILSKLGPLVIKALIASLTAA